MNNPKSNTYNTLAYERIENLDSSIVEHQKNLVSQDLEYYPSFHIAPAYGLLNDPNGLVYYNHEYHIFYQHCPNAPAHGMKSWHHLTTTDFVTYIDRGFPLTATSDYDNYGVYSGGAYVDGDNLVLLYTGNERRVSEGYKRYPNQCYAVMDKDYQIIDRGVFLKPDFNLHTEHFRDPVKYNEDIIIGAEDPMSKAQIMIYNIERQTLEYLQNDLDTQAAYMYECPNVAEFDGVELLMYCPQGLAKAENQNIYEVVYSVGSIGDIESRVWKTSQTHKVDFGFDFYAPQIFQQGQRTILIGWLGQANTNYPIDTELGWSQMLTMARELRLVNGILHQQPLVEYEQLMTTAKMVESGYQLTSRAFKLDFSSKGDFSLKIGNPNKFISLNKSGNKLVLDRTNCDYQIATEYGTQRTIEVDHSEVRVQMYIDHSAIEIFINDGRYVMTSRFYIKRLNQIVFNNLDIIKLSYMKTIQYKEK